MPPKSNTPIRRDVESVRDRILTAAQDEFMRAGYERANTNRMAKNFGLSKATIFRHFETKRDLFEAVVSRIAERWRNRVAIASVGNDDPEAWLFAFGISALQWILQEEALFVGRMAVAEGPNHEPARDLWPRFAATPVHRSLADRIATWLPNSAARVASPDDLANAFLDLVLAGQVSRALYGWPRDTPEMLERHVRMCVRIFVRGSELRARDGRSLNRPR